MSVHALRSSDPLAALRWLDVVLVLAAAPFVLIAGLPVLGYAVGAGMWTLQRVVAVAVEHAAKATGDYRKAIGFGVASMMVRSWVLALAILAVGLAAEREDGLTAAVLVLFAFTVYFAMHMILRSLEKGESRS